VAVTYRFDVPSLGIEVPLTAEACASFSGPTAPPATGAFLADCGPGFLGIVGRRGGPLQPLATAPAGTEVHIWDAAGKETVRHLDSYHGSIQQSADGTWPGHGVPPGTPVFIQLRGSGQATEREGVA
jgi:hypothetical protein